MRDLSRGKEENVPSELACTITETAFDGILGIQAKKIIYVNDALCRMTGFSREDLLESDISSLMSPEFLDGVEKLVEEGAVESDIIELGLLTQSGAKKIFEAGISSASYGDGELTVFVVRDISKRMKIQNSQHEVQKMEIIGRIARGLSHDFNNLLAAINGYLALARMENVAQVTLNRSYSLAKQAVEQAALLTKQLLAYTREGRFVMVSFDLKEEIGRILKTIRSSFRSNISMRLTTIDESLIIKADISQIQQLMWNIFLNSAEAMSDEGHVHIDLSKHTEWRGRNRKQKRDYARIRISDTGKGMERETLDRIFEPFFSTKGIGRGMGLAAVAGIVKGHEGKISVDSYIDRGTRIVIDFPLEKTELEKKKESDMDLDYSDSLILVADDDEMVREMAVECLKASGFQIIESADGLETMEAYNKMKDKIDLILLDIGMPFMDGLEVLSEIRQKEKDLPVILCSGYGKDEPIRNALKNSSTQFVAKPFDLMDLVDKINESIHNYKMSQKCRAC